MLPDPIYLSLQSQLSDQLSWFHTANTQGTLNDALKGQEQYGCAKEEPLEPSSRPPDGVAEAELTN